MAIVGWQLFRREGSDGLEMIGVDGDLLDDAPLAELPLACEITVEAPSTLPEFMASTQAAIDSVVATGRKATVLWVLVYLPSDEHAVRYSQIPLPAKASLSVAPANDPQWTIFDRARPVDMEMQSMQDLALMAELHAAGDVGGVRRVEHTVGGLAADRRTPFVAAARSVGFETEDAAAEPIVLHHRVDPSGITPDSWTLRLITERFGATYGGWSCELVRPAERRRPWRRR